MALTLIFQLGDETYGLEIEAIQEVIDDLPVHFVPHHDPVLIGAINFHGRILPVIDLPHLLGFEALERDQRLLVLTADYQALAMTVTRIERIVDLAPAATEAASPGEARRAVRSVADLDGRMINLLDTRAVLEQLETIYVA